MTKRSQQTLSVYTVASDDGGQDTWMKIGRAVAHDDGHGFDISLCALPLGTKLLLREQPQESPGGRAELSLAEQVEAFERAAIELCLIETGGSIAAALERLKVPRRTLNEKMARLGIDRRGLTMSLGRHQTDTTGPVKAADNGTMAGANSPSSLDHPLRLEKPSS